MTKPKKQINYLDVDLVKIMCHPLAVAHFDNGEQEPISSFQYCNVGKLDAALNNPKHFFAGKELYPTIYDKAAILFYSMIQNHPFANGNKRIATTSLLTFLYINDYWLEADKKEFAEQGIKIAESGEENISKDQSLANLKEWLIEKIKPYEH